MGAGKQVVGESAPRASSRVRVASKAGKVEPPRASLAPELSPLTGANETEWVDRASLRPHPRNYRTHPEDQLRHIGESIREHGFYRNVVIARDGTILAGHGVIEAAAKVGITRVPVFRLGISPESPAALKILTGDNELGRFAEVDDRALSELLKEIATTDEVNGLLGTGYDEKMLASLVMVTRPAAEIKDINAAAEWLGMPAYEEGGTPIRLVVSFNSDADRERFVKEQGMRIDKIAGATWSTRWPFTEREDVAGFRFEGADE